MIASSTSDLTHNNVSDAPDPVDIKRKLLNVSHIFSLYTFNYLLLASYFLRKNKMKRKCSELKASPLKTNYINLLCFVSHCMKNQSTPSKSTTKKIDNDPSLLYRGPGGSELPKEIIDELTRFTKKQRKDAVIDVWWLYDDGGLTLLLPYIISTRRNWNTCRLRVFALANRNSELEFEQRSMASLLSKFRIDYSDLILLPDISKKPEESTTAFFDDLIKNFVSSNDNSDECKYRFLIPFHPHSYSLPLSSFSFFSSST